MQPEITREWLASIGFASFDDCLILDCPNQESLLTRLIARRRDTGGFWFVLQQADCRSGKDWPTLECDCEYSDVLIDATTRAAVLVLLVVIGVGAKGG